MLVAPADKKLLIIADIHGDSQMLLDLLEKGGAVIDGQKNSEVWVCQLGDLCDCSGVSGDAEALELSRRYIDCQLIGNHELGWIRAGAPEFFGISVPSAEEAALIREIDWQPLAVAREKLLIHAGVGPLILERLGLAADEDDPLIVAEEISKRWEEYFYGDEDDEIFKAVGRYRGGSSDAGGIFWLDWGELTEQFAQSPDFALKQIIGHNRLLQPEILGPVSCIDVGGNWSETSYAILIEDRQEFLISKHRSS